MPHNPNVIFFPAADLSEQETLNAKERLVSLTDVTKRELWRSNPFLRFGDLALKNYMEDPRVLGTRTTEQLDAMRLGFQTYQYFSAIIRPGDSKEPLVGQIGLTIAEMNETRRIQRGSRALRKLRESYRQGLPRTNKHLEEFAGTSETSRFSFSEGASIAYRLELGARTLAALNIQPPSNTIDI